MQLQKYQSLNRTTVFSLFLNNFTDSIWLISSLFQHNTKELLPESQPTLITMSTPEFTAESNSELHYYFQTFSSSCCSLDFECTLVLLWCTTSLFSLASEPSPHLIFVFCLSWIPWKYPFPSSIISSLMLSVYCSYALKKFGHQTTQTTEAKKWEEY